MKMVLYCIQPLNINQSINKLRQRYDNNLIPFLSYCQLMRKRGVRFTAFISMCNNVCNLTQMSGRDTLTTMWHINLSKVYSFKAYILYHNLVEL